MTTNFPGKVFIVGAGPGDPELLTLKGKRCIAAAHVIVYDRLVNPALLRHASDEVELIYAGKQAGKPCADQRRIEAILVQHARAGEVVVRLKGGDPFIFGRGGEEAEALRKAGIDYEIVPGVSSAIAVPAYSGIPLTHREYASSVAIVTGHEVDKIKWRELLAAADTIVILMGLHNLRVIIDRVLAAGCGADKPVALIQSGTRSSQKKLAGTVHTIVGLAEGCNFESPTIIVLGEVIRLGDSLEWFRGALGGDTERSREEDYESYGGKHQLGLFKGSKNSHRAAFTGS